MSEYDDYDDEAPAPQKNPLRERMRELESEVKALRAEKIEAESARRELAFVKAGVPDTPATKYFVKAYDGPLDAEAIRTAATEAGYLSPVPQPEVAAEQQAWQRTNQAAAGAGNVEPPSINDRIRNANSEAEVLAILEEAQNS